MADNRRIIRLSKPQPLDIPDDCGRVPVLYGCEPVRISGNATTESSAGEEEGVEIKPARHHFQTMHELQWKEPVPNDFTPEEYFRGIPAYHIQDLEDKNIEIMLAQELFMGEYDLSFTKETSEVSKRDLEALYFSPGLNFLNDDFRRNFDEFQVKHPQLSKRHRAQTEDLEEFLSTQEKRNVNHNIMNYSTRDIQCEIEGMKKSDIESHQGENTVFAATPSGFVVSSPASPRRPDSKVMASLDNIEKSNELFKSTLSGRKLSIFMNKGVKSLTNSEVVCDSKHASRNNSINRLVNIMEKSTSDIQEDSEMIIDIPSSKRLPEKVSSQRFVQLNEEQIVCEFDANVSIDEILTTPIKKKSGRELNEGMFEVEVMSQESLPSLYIVIVEPCFMTCYLEVSKKKLNSRFQLGIYNKLAFLDVCKRQRIGSITKDDPGNSEVTQKDSARQNYKNIRPMSIEFDSTGNFISSHGIQLNKVVPEVKASSRSNSRRESANGQKSAKRIDPLDITKVNEERHTLHVKFSSVLEAVKNKGINGITEANKIHFNKHISSKSSQHLPFETPFNSNKWKPPTATSAFSKEKNSMKSETNISNHNSPVQKSQTRPSSKSKYRSFLQMPEVQPFARSEAHCQRLSSGLMTKESFERPSVDIANYNSASKKHKKPPVFKNIKTNDSFNMNANSKIPTKNTPKYSGPFSAKINSQQAFFGSDISGQSSHSKNHAKVDISKGLKHASSISNSHIRFSANSESPMLNSNQRLPRKKLTLKTHQSEKDSPTMMNIQDKKLSSHSSVKKLRNMIKNSPSNTKPKILNKEESPKKTTLLHLMSAKSISGNERPLTQKLLSKFK